MCNVDRLSPAALDRLRDGGAGMTGLTREQRIRAGALLRFRRGDRIVVRLADVSGSPTPHTDLAHDGREAVVVEGVTQAQHDGYRVRFASGHETHIFEHEAEALALA